MKNDFSKLRRFCRRVWDDYKDSKLNDEPNACFTRVEILGDFTVTVAIRSYPDDRAYGVVVSTGTRDRIFSRYDGYIQTDMNAAESRLEMKIYDMLCNASLGGDVDGIS